MSVRLVISEKVIESVIRHQYNSAYDALKENKSVEISGFGKFLFNQKKAEKKYNNYKRLKEELEEKLEKGDMPLKETNALKNKLSSISMTLTSIKPQINETSTDI